MAKLLININEGLIELEGNEDFVLKIYNDMKEKIQIQSNNLAKQTNVNNSNLIEKEPTNKTGSQKKKSLPKSYSLCKDLNLYKEGEHPSLKDFIRDYDTSSNLNRYLLFVHYLKVIKHVEKVGVNEIYTCFKNLNIKIPNIEQGLRDTASRKGWLNNSSSENVQITISGENAINHELLKNTDSKPE